MQHGMPTVLENIRYSNRHITSVILQKKKKGSSFKYIVEEFGLYLPHFFSSPLQEFWRIHMATMDTRASGDSNAFTMYVQGLTRRANATFYALFSAVRVRVGYFTTCVRARISARLVYLTHWAGNTYK